MFFSKLTMGFYDLAVNGTSIPEDAVEISKDEYAAFMLGQQQGLVLSCVNGRPVMVEYQETDDDIRCARDIKLATEVDTIAGNALRWAALTPEQQQAWADYRQALLDLPQQPGFPADVVWPTKPE